MKKYYVIMYQNQINGIKIPLIGMIDAFCLVILHGVLTDTPSCWFFVKVFIMKKLLALSAIALSVSAVAHASAPQVVVHIGGEVRDQTCAIDGASAVPVPLDAVKLSDLKNGVDNAKEFAVKFKNCNFNTNEHFFVAFDGSSPNITADGFLKNIASEYASSGVQIKIMTADGKKINLNKSDEARSQTIRARHLEKTNGSVEFKFKAGYALVDGVTNPTGGMVRSNIPVILQYQ